MPACLTKDSGERPAIHGNRVVFALNLKVWEYGSHLKTTIELADSLFRRAKNAALQEGITLKQLITDALESCLSGKRRTSKAGAPRWMRTYGALHHLHNDRKKIEDAVALEFENIEPEDRS